MDARRKARQREATTTRILVTCYYARMPEYMLYRISVRPGRHVVKQAAGSRGVMFFII